MQPLNAAASASGVYHFTHPILILWAHMRMVHHCVQSALAIIILARLTSPG